MIRAVGDSITYGFYDSVYPAPPNPLPDPLVNGYAAMTAAALGLAIGNTSFPGATMLGISGSASILAQMLALDPPSRYDIVLTMLGTNDMLLSGTDPTALANFSTGLREGLLWLTSNRRVPEPRTERERWRARTERPAAVPDGCRVFIGNTLAQSPYTGSASDAARALYTAQIEADAAYVNGRAGRVYVVDANAVFDPATQSPDGLHPSTAGHAAISGAYLAAIRAHP